MFEGKRHSPVEVETDARTPDLSIPRTLADLTVSLDTARVLQRAGFPQDTLFGWHFFGGGDPRPEPWVARHSGSNSTCAAPTFAEVWALLPESIIVDGETYWINHDRVTHERVFYADVIQRVLMLPNGHNAMEEHISPAEAAALLYLALVRAGHIGDATSPQTTP